MAGMGDDPSSTGPNRTSAGAPGWTGAIGSWEARGSWGAMGSGSPPGPIGAIGSTSALAVAFGGVGHDACIPVSRAASDGGDGAGLGAPDEPARSSAVAASDPVSTGALLKTRGPVAVAALGASAAGCSTAAAGLGGAASGFEVPPAAVAGLASAPKSTSPSSPKSSSAETPAGPASVPFPPRSGCNAESGCNADGSKTVVSFRVEASRRSY
jgi:hypothetical protein